ncbi:MAG: hypothetical protein A2Z18_07230 [Armatimonadetes bacterium RBG_16_58_9]|nr:MAG: hypothetical protein A2Z18_07230 [Armatimonadetes bacterium RBG_16_58_9]
MTLDASICPAISKCWLRLGTCATNAAGVASVMCLVLTKPVDFPVSRASSSIVRSLIPSGVTETIPFLVLTPVARAVAAAAESVTRHPTG